MISQALKIPKDTPFYIISNLQTSNNSPAILETKYSDNNPLNKNLYTENAFKSIHRAIKCLKEIDFVFKTNQKVYNKETITLKDLEKESYHIIIHDTIIIQPLNHLKASQKIALFESGNYFTSFTQAQIALEKINKLLEGSNK